MALKISSGWHRYYRHFAIFRSCRDFEPPFVQSVSKASGLLRSGAAGAANTGPEAQQIARTRAPLKFLVFR